MTNPMKKLYPFIILLSLLITSASCKKDSLADIEQSLVGSWEIRDVIGGQIPGDHASEPGNGNVLQFTATGYAYIVGAKVTYSGSYSVSIKGSGRNKEYILNLINNGSPMAFEIEGNKLSIYQGSIALDGATVIYERVKDPILETK
jgi:hypothetical protein